MLYFLIFASIVSFICSLFLQWRIHRQYAEIPELVETPCASIFGYYLPITEESKGIRLHEMTHFYCGHQVLNVLAQSFTMVVAYYFTGQFWMSWGISMAVIIGVSQLCELMADIVAFSVCGRSYVEDLRVITNRAPGPKPLLVASTLMKYPAYRVLLFDFNKNEETLFLKED